MRDEEALVVVTAAAARLQARIAGMQAANAWQLHCGNNPLYKQSDFEALVDDEGLGYNAVYALLRATNG